MQIVKPSVELLWITPDALQVIELAGRTCYKSEENITEDSAAKFVKMLISRNHDAVIEHASASFRIVTDRGITHEIVRHRVASYAQESTRYCNYSKEKFGNEISVIKPPSMTPLQEHEWKKACEEAERAYFEMLNSGASPQIARSVLPTCLKTEIVMTANFREWRHYLKLRTASGAHPQIIEVSNMIREVLMRACAPVFEDLG
ncbi:MAG: FAD-dependent thymidylate synthase [Planctomycetes bacterium]|nr:FAD-dependent thymidylate synthase [Planctomycetota bacterium]